MRRAHVTFSGRVQGVGFRFTAEMLSRRFKDLNGYVRNTPEGTVEVVCEGPDPEVKEFIDRLGEEMDRNITDRKITWEEPKGDLKPFRIRY